MNNIRKGSVVWDKRRKRKTTVLNSVSKGELSDNLMEVTGLSTHHIVAKSKLCYCSCEEGETNTTFNNKPCYMTPMYNLIPYKEYLQSLN